MTIKHYSQIIQNKNNVREGSQTFTPKCEFIFQIYNAEGNKTYYLQIQKLKIRVIDSSSSRY